jgi:stage V sporulation protein G
MEITETRILLVRNSDSAVRAYASIVLDNCFVVRGLKIISDSKGLFISMPSRKRPDGKFQDIAHPINNNTRLIIENTILEEYNRVLDSELNMETKRIWIE